MHEFYRHLQFEYEFGKWQFLKKTESVISLSHLEMYAENNMNKLNNSYLMTAPMGLKNWKTKMLTIDGQYSSGDTYEKISEFVVSEENSIFGKTD